ncbi:uncharacterized protein LOC129564964 [Sitodiplosis mosellana]|uniref:uncharacterized protein LOC129564964 n=1 Tax=Sitodiplosis mosellana TaxID=263140 RepID=UPI0024437F56|nr:uncharacterized protein LOC129564964 [Sitodiplosis mosellana]
MEAPLVFEDRRRNLQGHEFKATTIYIHKGSENHTDLDDYHHNKVDTISKVSFLISQHWIESVNATMVIDVGRTWGYPNRETDQLTGMSGRLQRKEADIGATVIFMLVERMPHLEYLSVMVPSEFGFILRSPPISYISNIYYLPFTGVVWICSITLVALCMAIIALTLRSHLKPDESTEIMTVFDGVLFAISTLCQKGTNILTNFMSARISLFTFYIALLFLYTSYTANIVALLQSTTKSIRTISDLQNPAIEVAVEDTPYNRHYFKTENEPTRKLLYDTKLAPLGESEAFINRSYGVSRLRKGMFAFHAEAPPIYRENEKNFFEHEKCGLVKIKFFGMSDTWCVIQKHSPYKEILKVSIFKIREHGIQSRERARVYPNRPTCASDGQNFGSVRLTDCFPVLLIFVYGFLTSFLLFCIETFFGAKLFVDCPAKIKQIIIRSKTE